MTQDKKVGLLERKPRLLQSRPWVLVALASLLANLAGCGPGIQYVFTPPTSAEGRVCASQCLNGQQQCRMLLNSQYQTCQSRWHYETQLYHQCRINAPDEQSRRRCWSPPACYYPPTYSCDEQYRACYQLCGGQVQAIQPPR